VFGFLEVVTVEIEKLIAGSWVNYLSSFEEDFANFSLKCSNFGILFSLSSGKSSVLFSNFGVFNGLSCLALFL